MPMRGGSCSQSLIGSGKQCSSKMLLAVRDPIKTEKFIRWAKKPYELMGELGGHLGLLIGASLLTLVEMLELVVMTWYKIFVRLVRHVDRQRRVQSIA